MLGAFLGRHPRKALPPPGGVVQPSLGLVDEPRMASVKATETTCLWAMHKTTVQFWISKLPAALQTESRELAEDRRRANMYKLFPLTPKVRCTDCSAGRRLCAVPVKVVMNWVGEWRVTRDVGVCMWHVRVAGCVESPSI